MADRIGTGFLNRRLLGSSGIVLWIPSDLRCFVDYLSFWGLDLGVGLRDIDRDLAIEVFEREDRLGTLIDDPEFPRRTLTFCYNRFPPCGKNTLVRAKIPDTAAAIRERLKGS